jgi:predicted nucleic acid-binding protein
MSTADTFFDTNVVLYLLSADVRKAGRSEDLIASGGQVSVQVLTEFAAVARRKLGMPCREVRDFTAQLRAVCRVWPVTLEVHDRGLRIAERLGLSVYDGTIAASALLAGCRILYSEDLQHGRVIDGVLTVRNPFV